MSLVASSGRPDEEFFEFGKIRRVEFSRRMFQIFSKRERCITREKISQLSWNLAKNDFYFFFYYFFLYFWHRFRVRKQNPGEM